MLKAVFIKRLFFLFCIIFMSTYAQGQKSLYKGQTRKRQGSSNITLNKISRNELITLFGTVGLASYNGDLSGNIFTRSYRPQIGGGAILRTGYFGKRLNLRADIRCFRLYSDDVHEGRNLNFRSTNWEFLALGQLDLFPYEKMMRRRTKINPYIYAGIGLMTFDPWGEMSNGKWHQLRPLETEHVKYGNVAFVYTAGLGFKYNHSYKWSFMIEGGYRFTTTDYIDDVSSTNYPAASSFDNGISRMMSNKSNNKNSLTGRGSPKYNDGYAMFSVGVMYTLTKHRSAIHKKSNNTLLRRN